MATANLTSTAQPIYTAIIEGRFARFYAGKRLVMVQRFPTNPDAVREAVSFIETMGSPQVQAATGCRLQAAD